MKTARRRSSFSLFLAALLVLASSAAEAAGKRVGVPKFDGAQEALVRKKVMAALKAHGYVLVRSRDMQEAADRTSARLDSDDGLQSLAKELALSAIVTGEVSGHKAKIVVHDGGEGSVLGEASFSGANPRKLAAEVGKTFWRKLGADVGRGHVPAGAKKNQKESSAASPEDNEESEGGAAGAAATGGEESKPSGESAESAPPPPPAEEAPAQARKKPKMETEASSSWSATGLPWLDVELGGGIYNRNLSYHQDISNNALLPYDLPAGPVLILNGVFYLEPLIPVLSNLGVEFELQQGIVSSRLQTTGSSSTETFSNTVHDYAGGVRYRFPFAASDEAFVSVTYGEDAFTFNGANRGNLLIPDTIYHYLRPGAGARFDVGGGFSVSVGLGYRALNAIAGIKSLTNAGGPQISKDFFPRLTVAGADAELMGSFALTDMIGLRAGVEWRRYWYAMNSQPGDTFVAGGAVDQSFAITGGVTLTLGSVAHPAVAAAPPPPPKPAKKTAPASDDSSGGGGSDEGGGSSSGGGPDE